MFFLWEGRFLSLLLSFSSRLIYGCDCLRGDSKSSHSASDVPAHPPVAEPKPVIDIFTGQVLDNYRWLEESDTPQTREMGGTRRMLIRGAARSSARARGHPQAAYGTAFDRDRYARQIAGKYYFYTRREGMQNQPVLYVRDTLERHDRVLVDANQLAPTAQSLSTGSSPATTESMSLMELLPAVRRCSTLHVIETKTGTILPDTIERTRAATIAWLHDNSGFYYTRYPNKGDVPRGQEMYNRHVFFHLTRQSGRKPTIPIFGEGRDPEDWPSVSLSNDGRWLLINVSQGWTKSELFLMDLKSGTAASG